MNDSNRSSTQQSRLTCAQTGLSADGSEQIRFSTFSTDGRQVMRAFDCSRCFSKVKPSEIRKERTIEDLTNAAWTDEYAHALQNGGLVSLGAAKDAGICSDARSAVFEALDATTDNKYQQQLAYMAHETTNGEVGDRHDPLVDHISSMFPEAPRSGGRH